MAILKNCCCFDSVRKGSFASAIFTLAFYTIIFMTCAFHVNTVFKEPVLLSVSLAMLILSVASVISSVLLIVGLCADNPRLMIPWIVSITLTTIVDIAICFYLMYDSDINIYIIIFFIIDFTICAINIYAILCVISQYQEYKSGRGFAYQKKFQQRLAVQQKDFLEVPNNGMAYKSSTENGSQIYYNNRQNFEYIVIPSPGSSPSSPMKSRISTDISSLFDEARRASALEEEIRIVVTPHEELNKTS